MVFYNIISCIFSCGEWWSGGFYPHKTKANNTSGPRLVGKCSRKCRRVVARLVESVRRVAGAGDQVSGFDLCLWLFTLTSQTVVFYTLLPLYSRLLLFVLVVRLFYTLLSCLYTNECFKWTTHPTNVHLSLTCFSTVFLFIFMRLVVAACLLWFWYFDIFQSQKCQRYK